MTPAASPNDGVSRIEAPAKINLALHVVGRRPDGFHDLETLAVFVEPGDTVTVEEADMDGFAIEGPFASALDPASPNLVTRARDALRAVAPEAVAPMRLRLTKRLPVSSGIGGGSSDAAATLRAIAGLRDISGQRLAEIAPRLGSDVPMCLAGAPLIARGTGDRIEKVQDLPALHLLLANPGVAVSTPAVFARLSRRDHPALPALPRETDAESLIDWLSRTRNDLAEPALSLVPAIGDVVRELDGAGSLFSRMSGSGATCFGIFADAATCRAAAERIGLRYPGWFLLPTHSPAPEPAHAAA